jgi:hypothetical protein
MEQFKTYDVPEKQPAYAKEILAMAQLDQDMRKKEEETGEYDENVDIRNTNRLKEIVSAIGWPTISKVGDEASTAAWLLVQHADFEFQQKCLELMKVEPESEVSGRDRAFLDDRVRVRLNQPTLYGTQFYRDNNGLLSVCSIEDKEHLNERRATVGLEPFEEYELWMQEYNDKKRKIVKSIGFLS